MIRESFADNLERHIRNTGYSYGQLAARSGLSKSTISNWANGYVTKPRFWQDVIKLAGALNLNESEATKMMLSAGHQAPAELLFKLSDEDEDKKLLNPWASAIRRRLQDAPFQAIADIPHFVGREKILDSLVMEVTSDLHPNIFCIQGMAGVGKTTLAVRLAYKTRYHFEDGVLWADLGSSDPMSVLVSFADSFGKDVSEYKDLATRSQVVRGLLSTKHALIVLDNVQESKDIEALIPPSVSCTVIVTTRRTNLRATRNARVIRIEPFDPREGESIALFAEVLGSDRVQQEKDILANIADILGHLPLAIDIAASRLSLEPNWESSDFLDYIREENRRLDTLQFDDSSIRISLNATFSRLPENLRLVFVPLGIFGDGSFGTDAVAYLTEIEEEEAANALRQLYGFSLIQLGKNVNRYRIHQLVRDFAREMMSDERVTHNFISYFLECAKKNRRDFPLLVLEKDHIVSALDLASRNEMKTKYVDAVLALHAFFDSMGGASLVRPYLDKALEFSQSNADYESAALILSRLGVSAINLGEFDLADEYLQKGLLLASAYDHQQVVCDIYALLGAASAYRGRIDTANNYYSEGLELARRIDYATGKAKFLNNLGSQAERRGDYVEAENLFEESLVVERDLGDETRVCFVLTNLGVVKTRTGNFNAAVNSFEEADRLARKLGNYSVLCNNLMNWGALMIVLGDLAHAEKYLREGLEIARSIEMHDNAAFIMANLGFVYAKLGDYNQAIAKIKESLDASYEMENRWLIAFGEEKYGEVLLLEGNPSGAKDAFGKAVAEAKEFEILDLLGLALFGMARSEYRLENLLKAQEYAAESLDTFTGIGHYMKEEVDEWIEERMPGF